jgi:hypothetical protein
MISAFGITHLISKAKEPYTTPEGNIYFEDRGPGYKGQTQGARNASREEFYRKHPSARPKPAPEPPPVKSALEQDMDMLEERMRKIRGEGQAAPERIPHPSGGRQTAPPGLWKKKGNKVPKGKWVVPAVATGVAATALAGSAAYANNQKNKKK